MADRPIPFSAPMVRALLEGRKTQTRRILKPQPSKPWGSACRDGNRFWTCDSLTGEVIEKWTLRYAPGDRLWVKEAIRFDAEWNDCKPSEFDRSDAIHYEADGHQETRAWGDPFTIGRLRRDRYMPRWASRITLTVTDVRVQRLYDITAKDSIAEGVQCETCEAMNQSACYGRGCYSSIDAYRMLWNSLHGPNAWDANPWVAAYSFTVQRGNIDQIVGGPGDRPAVSDGYEGSHHLTRRQGQGIGRAVDSGKSGRGGNG